MGSVRFTLLELLTVVSIVMVLAAIGLPVFHNAQLQARFSEIQVMTNHGLDTVTMYYEGNDLSPGAGVPLSGGPLNLAVCPTIGSEGKQRQAFTCGTAPDTEYMGEIGFSPDGDVYGTYWFNSTTFSDAGCPGALTGAEPMLTVSARHDLDGDAWPGVFMCCDGGTGTIYDDERRGRCGRQDAIRW